MLSKLTVLFLRHSGWLWCRQQGDYGFDQKPLFFSTHDMTLPTSAFSFDAAASRVHIQNQRIFGIFLGSALTLGPSLEMRASRKEVGVDTAWAFLQILSPEHLADIPILETRDPTLWPLPKDQPPHWYHTGYFVTSNEGQDIPALQTDLQEWIDERKAQGLSYAKRVSLI
jgi:hypothetical protein